MLYKDSVRSVTYKDRFTPAGGTESYQNVFFLKSGEAAVINLPEDTVDYYIKECGIDPNVYDKVSANGTQLTGTPTGNGSRKDYAVEAATMLERQKVDFDNHVRPGAMRTLSITKKLYDSDGITLLHYPDDDTMFTFRLYLGNESADPNSLPLAIIHTISRMLRGITAGGYLRRRSSYRWVSLITRNSPSICQHCQMPKRKKSYLRHR